MKSCEILLNFMKSCETLWIYEIQQISVQIWWTSGGFQIMQILFRFTTDFICRFQCGLHYGFHCDFIWILWISYEIHLIPYERPGESEESHLNQLFLLISCGFHVKSTGFHWNPPDFTWNLSDFMWNPLDFVKSARFHDERPLARNGNGYVSVISEKKLLKVFFKLLRFWIKIKCINMFWFHNQISNGVNNGSKINIYKI